MKKEKLPKILIDTEIRKELIREFGVTDTWVGLAVNGHRDTDLVRRIRKRALDLGGSIKGVEKIKML
ncbi:hypothetical protein [Massilibacteroides sp.]|uniref:hypothetical protein n=1 Tax=Massilibacteroides sp. TaxID=2034766 RepID=UPI00260EF3F0|nr:hypothetical protein [Massilibacteroides sp.]MDD4516859.1 hypothetical protein [Massilibacteroides sp.]